MTYQVLANDGSVMDAHLDIEGSEFVFHSRGGTRSKGTATNLDYGPAMRLLFVRLVDQGLSISGAWLETSRTVHLPRRARQIFGRSDFKADPGDWFTLITSRAQLFGRKPGAKPGGSRVKKVRIGVAGLRASVDLADCLGVQGKEGRRSTTRRSTINFDEISADAVWIAIQQLAASGDGASSSMRAFDLVAEGGLRLDPAQVFYHAARQALGALMSSDALRGLSTDEVRRRLIAFGYAVVPKGAEVETPELPVAPEDREWCEGEPRLVTHLKRERAGGLAKAKKSAFLREHGKLFCERCELDPLERFGREVGEACIEVHHRRTSVSRMLDGHVTVLEDLQCLCANCHRIIHAELRVAPS